MAQLTLDPRQEGLAEEAEALALALSGLSGRGAHRATATRLVGPAGQVVELPGAIFEALLAIADELRRGNGVTVLPLHQRLTTNEAAELLNVSRPHLVTLLERGEMPFEKVGTHRRVRLADVLAYRDRQERRRREALANLVRQGEELDLPY